MPKSNNKSLAEMSKCPSDAKQYAYFGCRVDEDLAVNKWKDHLTKRTKTMKTGGKASTTKTKKNQKTTEKSIEDSSKQETTEGGSTLDQPIPRKNHPKRKTNPPRACALGKFIFFVKMYLSSPCIFTWSVLTFSAKPEKKGSPPQGKRKNNRGKRKKEDIPEDLDTIQRKQLTMCFPFILSY